jgi:hypothetical protein
LPVVSSRAMSGTGQSTENGLDGTLGLWDDHPMTDGTAELDMSTDSMLFSGASMLQSWQSTDWLDLDSSVIPHPPTIYTWRLLTSRQGIRSCPQHGGYSSMNTTSDAGLLAVSSYTMRHDLTQ